MKRSTQFSTLAAALLLGAPASAQEPRPTGLATVRAIFTAADADADGLLQPREAVAQKIPVTDFATFDHDRDRQWSREEFTMYFRELLAKEGRPLGDDLEKEVARIHTQRRAVEAERARQREAARRAEAERAGNEAPQRAGARPISGRVEPRVPESPAIEAPPTEPPSVEARLDRARSALAGVVQNGRMTAAEARDFYDVLEARAAAAQDGSTPPGVEAIELRAKLQRARAELQSQVAAGALTIDEGREIDALLVERAHAAGAAPAADERALTPQDRERALAAERLERSRGRLQGLVQDGRLAAEDARDFDALLRERNAAAGEAGGSAEAGAAPQANREYLRGALERARGKLRALVRAGELDPQEARELELSLVERAQAAGVESIPVDAVDTGTDSDPEGGRSLPPDARERARTAGRLEDARAELQRLVQSGRLEAQEARDFHALLLDKAQDAQGGTGGADPPAGQASLRGALERAQDSLRRGVADGRIDAQVARRIEQALLERAQAAAIGDVPGGGVPERRDAAGEEAAAGGGAIPPGARERARTADRLDEARARLQRLVQSGRMDAEDARDFHALLLDQALEATGGADAAAEPAGLRAALDRARGTLRRMVAADRIDPQEARELEQVLIERARAAGVPAEGGPVEREGAAGPGGPPAAIPPDARERARTAERLEAARAHLQRLVQAGRLDVAQARDFHSLLLEKAKDASGEVPAEPNRRELAAALERARAQVRRLQEAGDLDAPAARELDGALVDRARAAGVGGPDDARQDGERGRPPEGAGQGPERAREGRGDVRPRPVGRGDGATPPARQGGERGRGTGTGRDGDGGGARGNSDGERPADRGDGATPPAKQGGDRGRGTESGRGDGGGKGGTRGNGGEERPRPKDGAGGQERRQGDPGARDGR